jgi:endonuclease/exonuclease/phosphatase family metal-dependent hydrolase
MTPFLLAAALVAADPSSVTLRVLSYNIHHGEGTDGQIDLPRLAKVITAAEPDLVALQEVDQGCRRSGGVDQTAELARLTQLHGRFGKQLDYDGGNYGQAVLSRWPIPELTIHWLPGMPERERRIAAVARFTLPDGPELIFGSTHLHHARNDIREQQTAELNRLFGSVEVPVVLVGDLNAPPEAKAIDILKPHWVIGAPTQNTFPAGKPTKVIDYVLGRPADRVQIVDIQVRDEPIASDHRPVLAVLTLRRSGPVDATGNTR